YTALSPRLKVDFVDPVQSPAKAQAYDVRGPWPILVVEKGSKRERVSNDGEQDVTNALIKLGREGKKTVCLLEGEGERSGEESGDRGFSGVKSSLTKSLYETKSVFLMREKTVPTDCTVLVVGGPEKDLLPETTAAVRDYVKRGGKAFVMVEPELKEHYPNLVALLKDWNIEAGQDVVVDVSGMGQLFGFSELAPLAIEYPYHAITKDFRLPTLYGGARSVQAGKGTVEGVSAQDLVKTSAQSWAESDLTLKSPIKFDDGKDKKGPISLAAVATVKAPAPAPTPTPSPAPSPAPEEPKTPEGRVVAVGDADFASNSLLGFQGNQDFFLNAVAWLAEDADLISIRPKEPENQALFLSRQVQQNVAWIALVILPGLFVVLGVVAWWRRR
ncbi:MAG TPA: Gldg family protein, partial [Vicinamibacteria bacterium]|nr:Gldg family protein [Vicinamibacteria bacterium]